MAWALQSAWYYKTMWETTLSEATYFFLGLSYFSLKDFNIQASESTQICVTRVFFLSLFSCNFHDQLSLLMTSFRINLVILKHSPCSSLYPLDVEGAVVIDEAVVVAPVSHPNDIISIQLDAGVVCCCCGCASLSPTRRSRPTSFSVFRKSLWVPPCRRYSAMMAAKMSELRPNLVRRSCKLKPRARANCFQLSPSVIPCISTKWENRMSCFKLKKIVEGLAFWP